MQRTLAAAVDTARTQPRTRPRHAIPDRDSLSVYGSLLSAERSQQPSSNQRATAHELLCEAEEALAAWRGRNLRWTAFGPINARLHRVNIAVTLGDAGTAIDVARTIDLNAITVTERKASLLIDTARAFLQWGRHEKAYIALRAARRSRTRKSPAGPRSSPSSATCCFGPALRPGRRGTVRRPERG